MECYSISINSDGTRLASGGLDGTVKMWDTATVVAFAKAGTLAKDKIIEDIPGIPEKSLWRPLCSMSRHNGVVTSVKFSPDGRFLASGSDDKIVLIWEKDEEQNRPRQFGETEQDLEHWTVRKRLVAHENDIQDICWSPDGSLLVTVGLDRSIMIWNGATFERIKRYDIHQSMVKGVVFDPANKYFATASDDRTVRIFRYYKKLNDFNNYEFQIEHIVIDPFKKSPLTSYFRRMSWSPDGQHIAVPNATNGPVTSVCVINRGNWETDVSLIGHEAPCEVCSFSPRLYDTSSQTKSSVNDKQRQLTTIVATGGQDNTLAVWSTISSKPLLVAEAIVSSSITDICWAPNGQTMYLSCLDGSITCVVFEDNELGTVVSLDVNDLQLHRYGTDRESTVFPESVDQLILEEKATLLERTRQLPPVPIDQELRPQTQSPNPEAKSLEKKSTPTVNVLTPKQVNKLTQSIVITKSGKKRITPILVSSTTKPTLTTSTNGSTFTSFSSKVSKPPSGAKKLSQSSYFLPKFGLQSAVYGFKLRTDDSDQRRQEDDQDNDNEDMVIDEASSNINQHNISETTLKRQRSKQKRIAMEMKYPQVFKQITNLPEGLFNNLQILTNEVTKILESFNKEISVESVNPLILELDEDLLFSVVLNKAKHKTVDSKDWISSSIEIRNGQSWTYDENEEFVDPNDRIDFQDATIVLVSNSIDLINRKFVLHFPYKIQHAYPVVVEDLLKYYVLVSFGGTVQIILADSGNYLCPSFELGENIVLVKSHGPYLMLVTGSGLIHSWKLNDCQFLIKKVCYGVSLATIVNSALNIPKDYDLKKTNLVSPNVKEISICADGSPMVMLDSNLDIYRYNIGMRSWTKVMDSWYYLALANIENDAEVPRMVSSLIRDYVDRTSKRLVVPYTFNESTVELKKSMEQRFLEHTDFFH